MSRPTQLCVATYHTHTDACMCLVCLFASTYTTAFNYLRRVLCGAGSPQPSKTPASSPTWTPTSTETGTVTHLFGTLRISFVSSCITLGKSLFVPWATFCSQFCACCCCLSAAMPMWLWLLHHAYIVENSWAARYYTWLSQSIDAKRHRPFVLFSVLFRSVPFRSVPFCSVLFCSVLFCSVLFCSVPFCFFPCFSFFPFLFFSFPLLRMHNPCSMLPFCNAMQQAFCMSARSPQQTSAHASCLPLM